MPIEFEWDPEKADTNLFKHDASFSEAATVFEDDFSTTFPDPDHSEDEDRYITIGMSSKARLLVVAHTDRGKRVRIISAREATRSEKRFYEESERI